MQVELSQQDVSDIKEALDAWERAESHSAFTGELLGLMLTPKDERKADDEFARESKERLRDAARKTEARRDKATMLRAKLIQASARASEHEEVTSCP